MRNPVGIATGFAVGALTRWAPPNAAMDETRVQALEEAIRRSPTESFPRYALALELSSSGRAAEAWPHFEYLLVNHPDYAATYYHAGMLLVKQGREPEARKVFERGIEVTVKQGNRHAQSELQAALNELAD